MDKYRIQRVLKVMSVILGTSNGQTSIFIKQINRPNTHGKLLVIKMVSCFMNVQLNHSGIGRCFVGVPIKVVPNGKSTYQKKIVRHMLKFKLVFIRLNYTQKPQLPIVQLNLCNYLEVVMQKTLIRCMTIQRILLNTSVIIFLLTQKKMNLIHQKFNQNKRVVNRQTSCYIKGMVLVGLKCSG